jgi:stage II sporulation protein R
MKKRIFAYILTVVLAILAVSAAVVVLVACHSDGDDYLRLHIRADGNGAAEQAVKLEVRDAVVAYLTPLAKEASNKRQMERLVSAHLDDVTQIANDVLCQNGYTYTARAYLSYEKFPEKTYGDLTLAEGYYDAIVIELGSGEGDNWWCVAFPPLCFVASEDVEGDAVVYRSVIAEWFSKNCR